MGKNMLPAATIGGALGVLVFILVTAAMGVDGDAILAATIYGAAAGGGAFYAIHKNPEEIDQFAELVGRKAPFLGKQVSLFREKHQQNVEAARAKRRVLLIATIEAFKAEQVEYLGDYDPRATPDKPDDLTLDELEVLQNGLPYRDAKEAISRTKRRHALEEKLEYINALFSDETNVLMFTSKEFLDRNPKLRKALRSHIHQMVNGGGAPINTSSGAAAAIGIIGEGIAAGRRASAQEGMRNGIEYLRFGRAIHDLKPNERAVLRTYFLLDAYGVMTPGALEQTHDSIVFNDGNCVTGCTIDNPDQHDLNGMKLAEDAIRNGIIKHHETMQMALTKFRTLADHEDETIAELIRQTFESGNSWATAEDIRRSQVYKTYEEGSADLLLGWYEDELPVGFGGYESLVTIARPGTGKTQSQVIPNMLTYPGSIIALDVKGELYDATAATRAERFGKVIKLDLRDIDQSHKYNPLLFCNKDKAWTEARFIADQLTGLSNDTSSDGSAAYFNGRARDVIQAFTAFLLMNEEKPRVSSILDMLSPTQAEFIDYLLDMRHAENKNLNRYANALENMEDKQREAVFDTARGKLNIFEDEIIDELTSDSDWRPEDLREPGTTLYLCVPEGGIASYSALLRLIIGQHLNLFHSPETGRPDLPLTCFLDEFPQLGYCEPLDKATELGRGRGVRLWMFAQDHEQIIDPYSQGLIDRCAIEMYMKPADATAEHLSRILGETEDIFTGEKKPLAPVHDLLGEKFSDKVIVKATGGKPAVLTKKMAYL